MYRRVLLKLSGEVLQGSGHVFCKDIFDSLVLQIKQVLEYGIEVGIVIGGGNIFRGARHSFSKSIDRVDGDAIGMVATVVNALALKSIFVESGIATEVCCSFDVSNFVKRHTKAEITANLAAGRVIIFAGGTGSAFFSTDTAAALRAAEINASVLLKATNVDGVYTADPKKNADAKLLQKITYNEAIINNYNVMDMCAFSLCRENKIPIFVFNIFSKDAIVNAVLSKLTGTFITE